MPDTFRFYDLRHTGDTLAADTGAKLRELMVRAGRPRGSMPRRGGNGACRARRREAPRVDHMNCVSLPEVIRCGACRDSPAGAFRVPLCLHLGTRGHVTPKLD